jgi:hypothetical protein
MGAAIHPREKPAHRLPRVDVMVCPSWRTVRFR